MSWLFSQALVEEYLGENFSDGEQSVPLNGNPTQQAYCAPDKMTVFSRLSRFGMTYKPLTESLGEELLTLYLEDFHAKTSPLQEEETDLTENDQECGQKWHGLLGRYDPDSHLWRTVQCSLLEDLNDALQILPRWGMTVGGELYLRPTSEQIIDENVSGLWPTPNAWDGKRGPRSAENLATKKHQINLITAVKWATPTVCGNNNRKGASKTSGDGLATQVGGQLNPTWVEWLMGWPLEWTDLKPLETDKSLCVQQPHGEF